MLDPAIAELFNDIANIALFVTFVAVLIFVAVYGVLYRWRKTRAGRSVFFMFGSLLIVSCLSFLAVWLGPEYLFRPLWRAAGWSAAAFSGIYILYALLRNWNRRESISVEPRTGSIAVTKEEQSA